jgi:hypothetical protein
VNLIVGHWSTSKREVVVIIVVAIAVPVPSEIADLQAL